MSMIGGIGGLGGYSALSALGTRGKNESSERDFLMAPAADVQAPSKPRHDNGESYRAEQAMDESFARLRLRLQEPGNGAAEMGISSGTLIRSLGDSGNVALDEFRQYMEMTPAEKMRDSILKELGLTEQELAAMPPEQQAAVEETIVQRIKERSEVAIAEGSEGQQSNPWGGQQVSGQAARAGGDVDARMAFSQFA